MEKAGTEKTAKKKVVKVEAIEHKQVTGKVLYYLKVWNEDGEYFINVGDKTYKEVCKLQGDEGK